MARIHEHTVNIAAPLTLVSAIPLAMQGDAEADELCLHVVNGKEPADMTGYAVGGYLERADGIRVMLKGKAAADVVEVKLQEACYRAPGAYKAFVRLTKTTGEKMTLFLFAGYIESEGDGEIVDEEDTLPSVEELIAMIEEIDRAIAGANTARDGANAAATRADAAAAEALKAAENAGRAEKAANDAAYEANAAADAANEAAVGASAWAKATMEAEPLPEGSAPTIVVGKNESGGNVIRVGIPAGRTGEAGVTPQITFEVETGAAGSDVKVEQSGTAEAPHIKLTIPRGDTGAVEGVDYYEGEPEPLGEANPGTANGLSRGNHVHPMPTAEDVGARPNTWTPTAEEVGALSSDGTAKDSEKLGGQLPGHYAKQETVNQLSEQMAALQSGVEIVPTVSGNVITLNDASNLPLRGMTIYGKTTQNGTPTPDNPVKLMTAGSGGVVYAMLPVGNNLFNIDCPTLSKTIINPSGEFIAEANYNCYRIPMVADVLSIGFTPNDTGNDPFRYAIEKDGIVTRYLINGTGGTTRVESNRADAIWLNPSVYQTDIMVNIGKTALAYEPYNGQILNLTTPNGLPGIPVTSGGNYTDVSGQQWICDEIDLERGIRIQRVISLGIDDFEFVKTSGDPKWFNSETADSYETNSLYILGEGTIGLCNVLKSYPFGEFYEKGIVDGVMNGQSYLVVNLAKSRGVDSVDRLKAWCAEVGFTVQKTLANPIETVLSAAELTSYRALVTNKPNTTIYNDAGDDMTVRYVADTQAYIDKQIGASAVAVNALVEGLTDE